MALFVADIQFIENEYSERKEHPPIARNLPPISGKIAWARQLYRRLSEPVEVFRENQELMALPETKKAIKKYNRIARVLVEYELIFVQEWSREIDNARASLNSTVLVRDPDTKELHVNFDRKILETMREMEVLTKMGVELPPQTRSFAGKDKQMKRKLDVISVNNTYSKSISVFDNYCACVLCLISFNPFHYVNIQYKYSVYTVI